MKKLIALLLTLPFAATSFAQSFTIEDDQANDVTNSLITVYYSPQDADVAVYLAVTNDAQTSTETKVKRIELNVVQGSENYFCWATCYGNMVAGVKPIFPTPLDPQWSHLLTLPAGYTVPADGNGFAAHHVPNGTSGLNCYRYVVFNGADVNDSIYVDICFDVSTGIAEQGVASFELDAYPNPVQSVASINYALDSNTEDNKIVLYNTLGAKVREVKLEDKEGVLKLNTVGLESGLYFYSLVANDQELTTKKLLISK